MSGQVCVGIHGHIYMDVFPHRNGVIVIINGKNKAQEESPFENGARARQRVRP